MSTHTTIARRTFTALSSTGLATAALTMLSAPAAEAAASQGAFGVGAPGTHRRHIPLDNETDPASDPALQQSVSEDEKIVEGEKVILDSRHVDLGPRLIDGQWIFAARDDTAETPTWRLPEDIVFQVHDAGLLPVPEDEAYSFIGAPAGEQVYVVPQTEVSGVVWLGWSTQDPAVVKACPRGATLSFTHVSGPGRFSLFLQPGNFAPPQLLVDGNTLADKPADVFVEINTHTHANWVFTKPGVYLVRVEARADAEDGTAYSAAGILRFAVGDATSVEETLAAEPTWDAGQAQGQASDGGSGAAASDSGSDASAAADASADSDADASRANAGAESSSSDSLPWLIGGGAAVVLAAGGGAYALSQKKAREARGEAEDGGQ